MLLMRMLTYARRSPRIDIETFPSWEPMLSNLLWPAWNELERLTVTGVAIVLDSTVFQDGFLVRFEKVAAEALGLRADAKALVLFHGWALPRDVDAALCGLVSMLELPSKHLFGAWCHTYLLDELQDLTLVLRLNHL